MNILYRTVRLYIKLGLLSYFKKIKAYGTENIPKDKAVMFVANHRNGMIDPLIIGITSNRYHHFLTRASAFKTPIANYLLRQLKMLPIYRVRDGMNTIQNNYKIFEACYAIFEKKGTVGIFPEGNHGLPRRVRRLSKGFTRITFGYLAKYPDKDLILVPVGLNYTDMQEKASEVSIYYGKPIQARKYYIPDNDKESIDGLKKVVSDTFKTLTTHIEDVDNHEKIERVLLQNGIDFLDPKKSNKSIATIKDWDISTKRITPKKSILYHVTFWLFSINTAIPLLLWNSLKHKSNDVVLIPTFRFGLAVGVIPLYYLLQGIIVASLTKPLYGIVYFTGSVLLLLLYRNSIQTDNVTTFPS